MSYELVTLPMGDVVSVLDWASAMPGYHQRADVKRLRQAVAMDPDFCEGDADREYEEHEIAAVGALPSVSDIPCGGLNLSEDLPYTADEAYDGAGYP